MDEENESIFQCEYLGCYFETDLLHRRKGKFYCSDCLKKVKKKEREKKKDGNMRILR